MKKNQGIAIVTVLIVMTIIITLVMTASLLSLSNRRSSVDNYAVVETQYVAEAGIEDAIAKIFYTTRANFDTLKANSQGPSAASTFDTCAFQLLLTGVVGIDTSAPAPNNNKNGTCPYLWNTDLAKRNSSTRIVNPSMPGLYDGATISLTGTLNGLGYTVSITRRDGSNGDINLSFASLARKLDASSNEIAARRVTRNLQIAGAPFPGDRFAMLTNNANCSFCHLQVDSMKRVYSTSSTAQFDGVYMGTVGGDLAFKNGGHYADSLIAGTVITRNANNPPENQGNPGTAGDGTYAAKWGSVPGTVKAGSAASILGDRFSTTVDPGDLTDKGNGANSPVAAALNAALNPTTPNAKMYYNYPTSATVKNAPFNDDYPDVELPDSFPLVIPDSNNNQLIDDIEWNTFIAQNSGGGDLTGGVIFGVRRPSSAAPAPATNNIPISYDPVSSNPGLYATTPAGSTGNLRTDLANLANNTLTRANFITFWRGWLIQQALASPNNRDYLPTNPTYMGTNPAGAASIQNVNFVARATANNATIIRFNANIAVPNPNYAIGSVVRCPNGYQSRIIGAIATNQVTVTAFNQNIPAGTTCTIFNFEPIYWPATNAAGLVNGASPNNFWVNYNPASNGTLTLQYCIAVCNYTGTAPFRSNNGTLGPATAVASFVLNNVNSVWFPSGNNAASTILASNGRFDGNLIVDGGRLVSGQADLGTPAQVARSALRISGTVSVNGDLVIRGRIQGTGRFVVRGNIYIVGDLVYDCGNQACSTQEYANATDDNMPKLAMLAGGVVTIGDYDAPDFRTNFFQNDLTNDQTYQFRNPSSNAADTDVSWGATNTRTPYLYYNIPGATGLNRNANFQQGWDVTGFVGRLITSPNSRNTGRYFASAPFGFINNCNDSAAYGVGANSCFINTATVGTTPLSIISLFPTNGPMALGNTNATNRGMFANPTVAANQMAANLGCENRAFDQALDPVLPPVGIGSGNWGQNPNPSVAANVGSPWRSSFSFSFWCSATNRSLRNGQQINTAANQSPATDAGAWYAQPIQNAALDTNLGMSTGWLAGLLGSNQTPVNTATATLGNFSQLGDLSQTRLLKLMWLATMEDGRRDADPRDSNTSGNDIKGPLRTDGIFYSPHGIFALARYYQNQNGGAESSTQSRWIHNGSVIASELGFLLTGNVTQSAEQFTTNNTAIMDFSPAENGGFKGPGMGIFYDDRLVGLLGIASTGTVQLNRTGNFSQTPR
jgi:hypothetical protein